MSLFVIPVLCLVLALPVAWFVSEFKTSKRSIHCTLGILAILSCFGIAWLTAQFERYNYNAWYGSASKALIDTTITQIEAGNTSLVLEKLKELQNDFHSTYENRAHYDVLVRETIKSINNKNM